MGNFTDAYNITVKGNEAGYNPGSSTIKETIDGIDRGQNPNNLAWPIVDAIKKANPDAGINELNAIFRANVKLQVIKTNFYLTEFWNPLKLSQVVDQNICNGMFDCSVNPCIDTAAKVFQKACNATLINTHSKLPQLVVDGSVGLKTISIVNALDPVQLYNSINTIRAANYHERVIRTPKMQVWLKIWLARLAPYNHNLINH